MKKLLMIFTFCFISHSAFADKLQGNFFCEKKFITDGSGGKFTLKINGNRMITKDIELNSSSEYKEVFFSVKKEYTVFVQIKNLFERLYIIAPTENKNKIMITQYDTENYYTKSVIAQGMCDKV